ncbi:MAG TPA: protoporphyrinogen oxidase [Thermoanaerobaculia bacterium]|nr:protoporphyrinogen oxidase [Thermoanaerobaculia bacterium]
MSNENSDALDVLDVLVIGGGISGLAAGFRLQRSGLKVAVLEASSRVGGAIATHSEGGWRFELGPNTVLESDPSVGELIAEAGLAGEKITASPAAKRRYLYKDGRLHALPGGPGGFLRTPLFPAGAKLRLLKEPWIGRPAGDPEESIATFVRRRLGQAFLDYAVGPFVSGVYAGDPERLSMRWALPRIAALEREHGSLIRGALARRQGAAAAGGRGAMISFQAGLEELPRRLAQEIGDVRTGVAALSVLRTDRGFRVETTAGPLLADRVILAAPADVAARLLDAATGGRSLALAEIPYAPVAVVALGYRREAIAHPLGGFGYLVPRKEGRRTLGCLFPSEIFPGRAPAGHVALAAFTGGRTDPEIVAWDEARIATQVAEEVGQALGIRSGRGEPVFRLVRRWPRAIPQYELGHGRFVALASEIERDLPGLRIGGNFLSGVSVPDCIRNGMKLAGEMAGTIRSRMRPGA